MQYKYITENNLENKQSYMYSVFFGEDFLKCFFKVRKKYIMNYNSIILETNILNFCEFTKGCYTEKIFSEIYFKLIESAKNFDELKIEIDQFTKSFEVRKRIYDNYNQEYRPLDGASYENYKTYLLFLLILQKAYEITKNYKYLNCLLKINDTIISVANNLDANASIIHKYIVNKELIFITDLCLKNNIQMEE